MNRQYCKDCDWWEDSAERCSESVMAPPPVEDGIKKPVRCGSCHKNHERLQALEDDWCGEFTPKT
jgi:hypothetical protein